MLRKHNRLLLEIELPQLFSRAPGGLLCAATLHVFSADFTLLGWVDPGADFALVARGILSEPWLPIPGCLKPMPLSLAGRTYLRFLHQLTEGELNERLRRRIERMPKESALPPGQNLAVIEQAKLPDKARRQLPSLLSGDFVRRGDNLLTFGLPGRGKTLFCAALGRELIQRHQLKVLFLPTFKLVNQLLVAKRDLKLPGLLAKLHRFDAIICDDLGYVSQAQDEMEVLFTFFAERYERQRSVLITSNLVFSEWDKIFKNPMTAMAAVDRLVHRSIILEFSGESFRANAAKDRRH